MRRVVLAGCGHAHLEVLRHASAFAARGTELLIVDPGLFWYSGRAGGHLGARFAARRETLDPAAIAKAHGARPIAARVIGLDRASRTITLDDGRRMHFDRLSFNIGSVIRRGFPATGAGLHPVKPISALPALSDAISRADRPLSLIVAGTGATGCEIAGNLLALRRVRTAPTEVMLVGEADDILTDAPAAIRRLARQSLERRGATLLLGTNIEAAADGVLYVSGGRRLPFDHLLIATGLGPDPLIERLGLPFSDDGLCVGKDLASIADPCFFAAGDCASFIDRRLPKRGVYGVRAGPVLARNLLASLDGRALEDWRPQERSLSILDLADGQGLAMRGDLWFAGRTAMLLKNALDRAFLRRHGALR